MREIYNKYPVGVLRKELTKIRKDVIVYNKTVLKDMKGLQKISKIPKKKIIDLLIYHAHDVNLLPPPPEPKTRAPRVKKASTKMTLTAPATATKPKRGYVSVKEKEARRKAREAKKLEKEAKKEASKANREAKKQASLAKKEAKKANAKPRGRPRKNV